ncbi:hypothetical protein FHG64_09120 [Antarcticibacterium flavum]|uniref:Lipoprotein n=1 Tax=Antarcticibacterium flavum TaxID=2058175 RepID=A0A5B7X2P6_9FLAO|nr:MULTISPECIES: hypothetical protein [Antarcticibacterium]MCM4159140.1 hypothetical protein [Antarcticibacterium sp. W02-3]QCY69540.1 hypothetical protein FHG64_09120 [Antarcticibacterium flavum]
MNKKYLKLLTLLILFNSCGNTQDRKKATIENFKEPFVDSLIPLPEKAYFVFYTKIKGYSNDTIRLNISSHESKESNLNYYFIGDFENEIRLDYYGESNKYITLYPYKATEGKIKLTYQL